MPPDLRAGLAALVRRWEVSAAAERRIAAQSTGHRASRCWALAEVTELHARQVRALLTHEED